MGYKESSGVTRVSTENAGQNAMNRVLKKVSRMIVIIAVTLLAVYMTALIALYLFQGGLLYFPTKALHGTPQLIGLNYEEAPLTTADGLTLSAWFVPADKARATLLFCHGNAGNIADRLESIRQFHNMGLNVFIFDYRGYGTSEGRPDEAGTYRDAEAAWKYLTDHRGIPDGNIVIIGRSLGGAIATWLAARHRPGALIVESSFTSVPDIAARQYPIFPVRLLSRFRYNTGAHIRQVTAPVLIVHSPDDELVPFSQGEQLFALANEPKQFLRLTGTHNDGNLQSATLYEQQVSEFINRYIRP